MKEKITCNEFIKKYHKDIEAYSKSLNSELFGNTIEEMLKFMRYQGVNIYLEKDGMYLYK